MFDNIHEQQLIEDYINLMRFVSDPEPKDFVFKCFSGDSNIHTIWHHTYINCIYSLKVLSVFSILSIFQNEERPRKQSTNNYTPPQIQKSMSASSLSKTSSLNQIKFSGFSEKRKVSLTFLTQYANLKIPQDFFGILEDIRSGLYPRLFRNKERLTSSSSSYKLRSVSSTSCLDFVIQQKQIIDRRSSCMIGYERSGSTNCLDMIDNCEQVAKEDPSLFKYPIETRRVRQEECNIKILDYDSQVQFTVDLVFDDRLSRSLTSVFPVSFLNYFKPETDANLSAKIFSLGPNQDEFLNLICSSTDNEYTFDSKLENISIHLANELIDQGLINPNDHGLIADLFIRTIKEFVVQ
ncbi:hypothetical protein BpHYR1_007305 [Brachionus plicatilis]|uniref:Uncharacterized protein n=1 Tax=Brachionus plicatilis TaxID=10195 RepID=A0A3M7RB38_BRAPC|nr:hypothetical protein BpHYR1_007305 [Brachionus plicatilis]